MPLEVPSALEEPVLEGRAKLGMVKTMLVPVVSVAKIDDGAAGGPEGAAVLEEPSLDGPSALEEGGSIDGIDGVGGNKLLGGVAKVGGTDGPERIGGNRLLGGVAKEDGMLFVAVKLLGGGAKVGGTVFVVVRLLGGREKVGGIVFVPRLHSKVEEDAVSGVLG